MACRRASISNVLAINGSVYRTTKRPRSSPRRSKNIAETYTGDEGQRRLREQKYDEVTVAATQGAGTQVLKFRGGMPLLGMTRVFGMYRFANSMALLGRGHPQGRARQGARGPRLRQLQLAHRSAAWPSDGHRPANRRVRFERRRALQDSRGVGNELDHDQDARRALADRSPDQGDARGSDRLRVLGHVEQGGQRDRGSARHDARAGPRPGAT